MPKFWENSGQSYYIGITPIYTKNLYLSVFELLIYQIAKTHTKQNLWRKRITLPKTCILSVYDHVIYKNA